MEYNFGKGNYCSDCGVYTPYTALTQHTYVDPVDEPYYLHKDKDLCNSLLKEAYRLSQEEEYADIDQYFALQEEGD